MINFLKPNIAIGIKHLLNLKESKFEWIVDLGGQNGYSYSFFPPNVVSNWSSEISWRRRVFTSFVWTNSILLWADFGINCRIIFQTNCSDLDGL